MLAGLSKCQYIESMVNYNYYKTNEYAFRPDPRFPLRVSVMDPQTTTVFHRHEFTECIFITGGEGLHQSDKEKPVPIKRGDILIIPPNGMHAYVESEGLTLINLLFDAGRLPAVLMELYSHPAYKELFMQDVSRYRNRNFPCFTPPESDFSELEAFAYRIAQYGDKRGNHCYKLGLFMALLSLLCNSRQVETKGIPDVPLDIPKLIDFLKQNFQRKIYLDDMASLAAMSRSTLLRHFRAALGVTPIEYLRNLRLQHAAELLLNTNLTPTEISEQSGFPTLAYFFRAFKCHYGVSPLAYRHKD